MRCDKPVLFFEADTAMSAESLKCLHKVMDGRLGDRYQCVILSDGLKLANQQEFRPETIFVNVGNIQITGEATSTGTRGTVVIDGVEIKHVRRVVVEMTHNETPTVKLELIAK